VGFGDPCAEGNQCSSNACVALPNGEGYCTQTCSDAACPYGFECSTTAQGSFCFLADGRGGAGGAGGATDGYPGLQSTCSATPGLPVAPTALLAALVLPALAYRRRRR